MGLAVAAALTCGLTVLLAGWGLPPVCASALATLAVVRGLPREGAWASSAFAGSFAGMTGVDHHPVELAGLVAVALALGVGGLFALLEARIDAWWARWGRGLGGRLGTVAFLASLPLGWAFAGPNVAMDDPRQLAGMVLLAAAGAVLPRTLAWGSVVQRTAVWGLVGGLVLWSAPAWAGAWYTGCFVSMTAPHIVPHPVGRGATGGVAGLAYAALAWALPAVGGSMGLAAFLAVGAVHRGGRALGRTAG